MTNDCLCFGILLLALSSCSVSPPNSSYSPLYSATTALPLYATEAYPEGRFNFVAYPKGFDESRVFKLTACQDTSGMTLLQRRAAASSQQPGGRRQAVEGPGVLWLGGMSCYIDETEISNLDWQHFLNCLRADSAEEMYQGFLPLPDAQPVPDYFTNPFYRYYPVVGISHEQAQGYCQWRSAVVSYNYNRLRSAQAPEQQFVYRLPTEPEWEYAAVSFSGQPYGTACPDRRVTINPKAAAYLQARSKSFVQLEQIAKDIELFNADKSLITWINCQRQLPYFLQSPTPDYIYNSAPNLFGLYQMPGNVAELVQEPGITKGGSYRDPLAACAIKARGRYTGPAPTIGFRCVCVMTFPNRK